MTVKRLRSVICMLLFFGFVGSIAVSLVQYSTAKDFIDQFSGDGSADPFTKALYKRLSRFAVVTSIIFASLLVATVVMPSQKILNAVEGIALHRRIQNSLRWWKLAGHRQWGWMLAFTILAVILRLPYLHDAIRYDEAHSYLNYASYPWFVIVSDYTDPNNHILQSLLVRLSTSLFGTNEWAIRLPAFISGVALVPLTFMTARIAGGVRAAYVATLLVTVWSAMIEYSVLARGYSLICCCTVLNLFVAMRILRGQRGLEWPVLICSSTIGLWTVPTMAYANVITWGWLLMMGLFSAREHRMKTSRFLLHWVTSATMTVSLSLLLYTPVLLTGRFDGQMGSGFIEETTITEYLPLLFTHLFGGHSLFGRNLQMWMLVVLSLSPCLLLAGSQGRKVLLATTLATASLIALLSVQRVIPPERTFLFLIPLISIWTGYSLAESFHLKLQQVVSGACLTLGLLVPLVMLFSHYQKNLIEESSEGGVCPDAQEIVDFLIETQSSINLDDTRIVAVSPTSAPIVYYSQRHGLEDELFRVPDLNHSGPVVVVISHLEKQTPRMVLEQLNLENLNNTRQFKKWKRFATTTLYLAKSMTPLN